MNKIYVNQILQLIKVKYEILIGDESRYITKITSLNDADEESLIFINAGRNDVQIIIENTLAPIIICQKYNFISDKILKTKNFIFVENPKVVLAQIGNYLFQKGITYKVHPTAVISPKAEIHPESFIGPFSYIGECRIGKGTVIFGNCYIHDNVIIGSNVIINAGVIIGSDGFGYEKDENGNIFNFPHIGGVIIEDNVHIGANTCIDRGSLGNTIICDGAKIDNLVHVAHNVVIGKNSFVIANAMIGGSTRIKDNSWISPSVSLRDQITIGENTLVGMGAVVTKSIGDNQTWTGNPARSLEELKNINEKLKKL